MYYVQISIKLCCYIFIGLYGTGSILQPKVALSRSTYFLVAFRKRPHRFLAAIFLCDFRIPTPNGWNDAHFVDRSEWLTVFFVVQK